MIADLSLPPTVGAGAAQSYAACDPLVYQGDYLACNLFDVLARLPEIRCPTVVVCGLADRLTPPKYSEALRDHIHGARY